VVLLKAKGGNNNVDGFAHSNALLAQGTKVVGANDGQVSVDELKYG
jgi:hypothetical protein